MSLLRMDRIVAQKNIVRAITAKPRARNALNIVSWMMDGCD